MTKGLEGIPIWLNDTRFSCEHSRDGFKVRWERTAMSRKSHTVSFCQLPLEFEALMFGVQVPIPNVGNMPKESIEFVVLLLCLSLEIFCS